MSKPASHSITIWMACSQAEIYLFKIGIPLSESPPSPLFYALRKLGMNPSSSTNSAALASFRFRIWLPGFGLIFFFLLLEKEDLVLNLLFSPYCVQWRTFLGYVQVQAHFCISASTAWAKSCLALIQDVRAFPHSLDIQLCSTGILDPRAAGMATASECIFPIAVFFFFLFYFFLPAPFFYHLPHSLHSSSSIQPKPWGSLLLPEGCKDLTSFSLSQVLFLLNSAGSFYSPFLKKKPQESCTYIYTSFS